MTTATVQEKLIYFRLLFLLSCCPAGGGASWSLTLATSPEHEPRLSIDSTDQLQYLTGLCHLAPPDRSAQTTRSIHVDQRRFTLGTKSVVDLFLAGQQNQHRTSTRAGFSPAAADGQSDREWASGSEGKERCTQLYTEAAAKNTKSEIGWGKYSIFRLYSIYNKCARRRRPMLLI